MPHIRSSAFLDFPSTEKVKRRWTQGGRNKKSLRSKQKGISTPAGLDLLTAFLHRFMHWDGPGRGRLNLALQPLLLLVKPEPRSPEAVGQPREPIKVSPRSRHEAEASAPGSRARSRWRRGSCQQSSAPTWYHYIMFEPWPAQGCRSGLWRVTPLIVLQNASRHLYKEEFPK